MRRPPRRPVAEAEAPTPRPVAEEAVAAEEELDEETAARQAGDPGRRPRGRHRRRGRGSARTRRGRRVRRRRGAASRAPRARTRTTSTTSRSPPSSSSPPTRATARPASARRAVARVILKPGTGAYIINGKTLDDFFPRPALQRIIRQPLETVGYEERMDVIARMHGGGVSAQAGALRHGISQGAARGRPEPSRRAQAPRLPDARRAREGAQEGRSQEGPQAAAVQQALADRAPGALFDGA